MSCRVILVSRVEYQRPPGLGRLTTFGVLVLLWFLVVGGGGRRREGAVYHVTVVTMAGRLESRNEKHLNIYFFFSVCRTLVVKYMDSTTISIFESYTLKGRCHE